MRITFNQHIIERPSNKHSHNVAQQQRRNVLKQHLQSVFRMLLRHNMTKCFIIFAFYEGNTLQNILLNASPVITMKTCFPCNIQKTFSRCYQGLRWQNILPVMWYINEGGTFCQECSEDVLEMLLREPIVKVIKHSNNVP